MRHATMLDNEGQWVPKYRISLRAWRDYCKPDPNKPGHTMWERARDHAASQAPRAGPSTLLGAADRMLAILAIIQSRQGSPFLVEDIKDYAREIAIHLGRTCHATGLQYSIDSTMEGWYKVRSVHVRTTSFKYA